MYTYFDHSSWTYMFIALDKSNGKTTIPLNAC